MKEEAATLGWETVNALRAEPQPAARGEEIDFILLIHLSSTPRLLYQQKESFWQGEEAEGWKGSKSFRHSWNNDPQKAKSVSTQDGRK